MVSLLKKCLLQDRVLQLEKMSVFCANGGRCLRLNRNMIAIPLTILETVEESGFRTTRAVSIASGTGTMIT